MTDLADLIARLEEATGPSRELDYEIALLVDWHIGPGLSLRQWAEAHPKAARSEQYPAYTASVDAALSLVPEGWTGRVYFGPKPRPPQPENHSDAAIWSPDKTKLESFSGPAGNAATPALALCIAALRARGVQP